MYLTIEVPHQRPAAVYVWTDEAEALAAYREALCELVCMEESDALIWEHAEHDLASFFRGTPGEAFEWAAKLEHQGHRVRRLLHARWSRPWYLAEK